MGEAAAEQGAGPKRFDWERLLQDESERHALCRSMAELGFAVVRAPRTVARAVKAVASSAPCFFSKPVEEKRRLGNVRYAKGKLVGYLQRHDGAQFLEMHATPTGLAAPEPDGLRAFCAACNLLHEELLQMGRSVLGWMADRLGVPQEALLAPLDTPGLDDLDPEDFGSCVLRLCNYRLCADEEVFREHTDASFLTVAPRSSTPGLQMWHAPSSSWLDVERGLQPTDIVIFVGDFVEVLTKGSYTAALHRVVLRPEDATDRISMPFLMRGQPRAELHTVPMLEANPQLPLMRLDHIPYEDLRLFLDLKGKKRMQNRALLAEAGVAPIPDEALAPSGRGR